MIYSRIGRLLDDENRNEYGATYAWFIKLSNYQIIIKLNVMCVEMFKFFFSFSERYRLASM